MTKKNLFQVFALSSLACGLIACSAAPIGTAKIIEEDQSQIALLLNKDLSVTVAGLKNGTRVEPCDLDDASANSDATSQSSPVSSDKLGAAPSKIKCKKDHGVSIYKETFTIEVRKGSCCVTMTNTVGVVRQLCSPPDGNFPIEFIKKLNSQSDQQCN